MEYGSYIINSALRKVGSEMDHQNYPALYIAASEASKIAQDNVLLFYKLNSFLLIVAAALSLIGVQNACLAIISALVFIASLLVYIYGRSQNFQGRWYKARALAESIKTATWRLVMSAEPFNSPERIQNLEDFSKLLDELLVENKGIGAQLAGNPAELPQITPKIIELLDKNYEEKREFYLEKRIKDQRSWYAMKSGQNYNSSKNYLIVLCVIYGIAIILVLVRIAIPTMTFVPVDVLAVVASSIIGWTQIKRFDELTSSYSLTAYEIGVIEGRFLNVKDSEHLSRFVKDAENAFSREHTQWAARRDS